MIQIKSNILKYLKIIRDMPEMVFKVVNQEFHAFGIAFPGYMAKNFKGRPGLNQPTGNLLKSWQSKVDGDDLASLQLTLFNAAPYAKMQEYGKAGHGPTNAKFLAIPIGEARTSGGQPRYKSPLREDSSLVNLRPFVFKSKAGNLILGYNRGRDDLVPLFVLKTSVDIPARMGARAMLKSKFGPLAKRIRGRAVKAWEQAKAEATGDGG